MKTKKIIMTGGSGRSAKVFKKMKKRGKFISLLKNLKYKKSWFN